MLRRHLPYYYRDCRWRRLQLRSFHGSLYFSIAKETIQTPQERPVSLTDLIHRRMERRTKQSLLVGMPTDRVPSSSTVNRVRSILQPTSAGTKTQTAAMNRTDRTNALRQALRQTLLRTNRTIPHSQHELPPPPPPPLLSPPSTTGTSPANATPTPNQSESPLSEFIRRIQLEQEAKKIEQQQNKNSTSESSSVTKPLPRWRIPTEHKRTSISLRRQDHQQHHRRQKEDNNKSSIVQPKKSFVMPKQHIAILPSSESISLLDASMVFRKKVSKLRYALRKLNLWSDLLRHANNNDDDESILLDPDTLELVAMELNIPFEKAGQVSTATTKDEILLQRRRVPVETPVTQEWTKRSPVVAIAGHVDHGKTTLLDSLRRRAMGRAGQTGDRTVVVDTVSDIAGTEAGGITQAISSFQVQLQDAQEASVTILDTPGHAAFKAMRQSGSDAADIIVLVVAADDGVSKQTVEVLDFYKSIVKGSGTSGVALVVALNKIDKPGIDVQEATRRVEGQLLEHGILVEGMPSSGGSEYGPPVQLIPVSGLTGQGLDDLIEGLVLQAEVMDLRADEDAPAEGIVLDGRVHKGLGIVADCIIRWGSIQKGDYVVSGSNMGKVRVLKDSNGKTLKRGMPSQPVSIIGFDSVPKAGDSIVVVESEEAAREMASLQKIDDETTDIDVSVSPSNAVLQSSGRHMLHADWKEALEEKHGIEADLDSPTKIPVIVKADADGSLAAVRDAVVALAQECSRDIVIDPVKVGVGPVLASDIQMAKEGGATIICFNIKNEQIITRLAEEEGVSIVGSDVIYRLLDESKLAFTKYLPFEEFDIVHGKGQVKALYDIEGIVDKVAGVQVTDGTFFKDKVVLKGDRVQAKYRVVRDGKVITEADLVVSSLKHFKDNVSEVARGKDCGISLFGFSNYEEGDIIECFSTGRKREFK